VSSGSGGNKAISVKLTRDGSVLDASYVRTLGSGEDGVVTIHGWDASAAGSHTIELKASADKTGSTATARRLSVVELQ